MREILDLINRMSPYLLLGFLLAGVMHAFVPHSIYRKYLGGNSFRSVLNATLLGIPIPLCSCGVIPTAMSLRKEGASKGAAVSFLIATPQTGIDSIIATYSLMGLPFALTRPIAALVTSLFGGQMVNILDKETDGAAIRPGKDETEMTTFRQKVKEVFRYAYVEMMQDIGRWLVIGLMIAGLITVFVPDSFFALFADNSLVSMLIVLVFAIPMYLCATGSIPIAAALMMKGLSPGTALVLLMAGPAVNAASMLVVGKILGKKTMLIYILSITAGAILFGLGIDCLMPREWFAMPIAKMGGCSGEGISWFNIICTTVMLLLLVNAMIMRFMHKGRKNGTEVQTGTRTYRIEGLRCNKCKANAEKAIASLDGIESVSIDLPTGMAEITGTAEEAEIAKALENIGFNLRKTE